MQIKAQFDSEESLSANLFKNCLNNHIPGAQLWKKRRHLLDTKDLTKQEVDCLLQLTSVCKKMLQARVAPLTTLSNKIIANIFYENSTRTRSSFELAARKLGALILNLDVQSSSTVKGETFIDTAQTLASMNVDLIVQRHPSPGSAHQLAKYFDKNKFDKYKQEAAGDKQNDVHIINAGDGWHAHPTQALLDLFTMIESKPELFKGNVKPKVTIAGDIIHSRVARSNIWLLKMFGADVHVVGPPTLVPTFLAKYDVIIHNQLETAIEKADFIIVLRMQKERQQLGLIPSISEYQKLYRLDHKQLQLCKQDVKVMHPGPFNRDIEITGKLADDRQFSLINEQVSNGVATRMAVMYLLLSDREDGN